MSKTKMVPVNPRAYAKYVKRLKQLCALGWSLDVARRVTFDPTLHAVNFVRQEVGQAAFNSAIRYAPRNKVTEGRPGEGWGVWDGARMTWELWPDWTRTWDAARLAARRLNRGARSEGGQTDLSCLHDDCYSEDQVDELRERVTALEGIVRSVAKANTRPGKNASRIFAGLHAETITEAHELMETA